MASPRIEWTSTRYGGARGTVGNPRATLFQIVYTHDRALISAGTPYELEHKLPFRRITRHFPSPEHAKHYAEGYLLKAMEALGFEPKED